ncbi:MAG TPA: hypothetical protein VKC17_08420 [Sphingomicrobium sp.]|nr:hypothetical protein [Sphingomicrobium sp.]
MLSLLILSAAITAQPEPVLLCNGIRVENINPATMIHVRLGEVGDQELAPQEGGYAISAANGAREVATALTGNAGVFYGYARLSARFTPCKADQRSLIPEKRDPISRFFAGKQVDKVLQIRVTVTPINVSSATTLAGIHRKSGKGGEEWSTDVENGMVLLPYVRIDENTLIRVQADFTATREYNSSIGSDVLGIVKRASALISPAAPLITDQNKDRFNDAATFFDSTINGLLKVSVLEKPGRTFAIADRPGRQDLAVVTLVVPWANDVYPSAKSSMIAIGQWTIYAEPLRRSMLAKVDDAGQVVPGSFTSATVMNFGVAENKTLGEALAGSSDIIAARDSLVGAEVGDSTDSGRVFCRAVQREAERLELAPIDAGLAAWAALADLALPDAKMTNAMAGCNRIEHFRAVAVASSADLADANN